MRNCFYQFITQMASRWRTGYGIITVLLISSLLAGCRSSGKELLKYPPPAAETEERLLSVTQQLLALPENADLKTRSELRREFEAALAEYLLATRGNLPKNLEFTRNGKVFQLPVEIIRSGVVPVNGDHPATNVMSGDTLIAKLAGEVLDMQLLAADNRQYLALLFADSLVAIPWQPFNPARRLVYPFPEQPERPIRSAYPFGWLHLNDPEGYGVAELVMLTSNLQRALTLSPTSDHLRKIDGDSLQSNPAHPGNWHIPSGKNELRPKTGLLPEASPYLAFREIPGTGEIVALDDAGMLQLIDRSNYEIIWTSARAWGKRLFVMDSTEIAVVDDEKNTLVLFRRTNGELVPDGKTPSLNGRISAALRTVYQNNPGFLIAASSENQPKILSRLEFVPLLEMVWETAGSASPPKFPDEYASLTFVQPDKGDGLLPQIARYNLYESLASKNTAGNGQFALATEISRNDSATVWTIQLRPGLRFSDRDLVSAEKVIAGWLWLWRNDPVAKNSRRWMWETITGTNDFISRKSNEISGLKAINSQTIEITLSDPRAHFGEYLSGEAFAVVKSPATGKLPLGTGPFRVKSARGDRVVAERNDVYHGGRPLLQEIHFIRQDGNLADALLNYREPAALVQTRRDIEYFSKVYPQNIRQLPGANVYYLLANPAAPGMNKPQSRRNLMHMLDREVLADVITEARCEQVSSFFYPATDSVETSGTFAINRPVRIIYRAIDGVARQIAERLAVRLAQSNIPVYPPTGLDDGSFAIRRTRPDFDVLVDALPLLHDNPLDNIAQLTFDNPVLPDSLRTKLRSALRDSSETGQSIEHLLIGEGFVFPVVKMHLFVAIPKDLRQVWSSGTSRIDFSKAWKPR